jgi:5-formyltetrahydrofolate cyclo-ligase
MSKSAPRLAALARRDALDAGVRRDAADALAATPLPVEMVQGTVVAGYSPIRNEIDPIPLMQALAERGATLALPVMVGNDMPLFFREWHPSDGLVRGSFGVFQPSSDAREVEPDIVLVPLAAFDRSGQRIGYGRGFYDRTIEGLRAHKKVVIIGIAFATQEIDSVAVQSHDQRLDCVLTEQEFIDLRSL